MNILWVKDNNIGHEKQVKNLLDEISKKIDLHIDADNEFVLTELRDEEKSINKTRHMSKKSGHLQRN